MRGLLDEWMDAWIVERMMHELLDGWMDGQMQEWVVG